MSGAVVLAAVSVWQRAGPGESVGGVCGSWLSVFAREGVEAVSIGQYFPELSMWIRVGRVHRRGRRSHGTIPSTMRRAEVNWVMRVVGRLPREPSCSPLRRKLPGYGFGLLGH